ncbi:MAG: hypothetical protein JWM21_2894 [Acidobacteria bacterium]|nr:hypothetical protein [Acidobacteriota bacterium]
MSRLGVLFFICALAFMPTYPAWAQQPDSINQLKEQIKQMEAIDRDPAIPADTKSLNRDFLKARRSQLHDLLVKNLEALRRYQSNLSSSLTVEESRVVEDSIHDFEQALQEEKEALASSANPSERPVGDPSRVSQSARPARATNNVVDVGPPRTETRMPRAAMSSVAARLDGAPAVPPSLCTVGYPDVPPRLDQMAEATAILVVREAVKDRAKGLPIEKDTLDIPGAFQRHYDEMVYLTVANALFTDAEQAGLSELRWQEFTAESRRTDKQNGASSRAGGSTSAAEKPGFSDLLAFAVEHGAIQKEVNQTSLTLSSSPYALIAATQGDTSELYRKYDFFNRIGVSANFNLANQNNALANATRKQLNEWSVKVRLNPDRTARGKDFQAFWDKNILPKIAQRAIILTKGFDAAFNKEDDLKALHENVFLRFDGPSGFVVSNLAGTSSSAEADQVAALKKEILCRLRSEVYDPVKAGTTIKVSSGFKEFLNNSIVEFARAQKLAEEGRDAMRKEIKELNDKPTSSVSYTNLRPATGSYYSVFKGMYLQKTFDPMKLLANAEIAFYHKPDPKMNQQRIRDIIIALSFEGSAGPSPFITTERDESQVTYSFTGSYQRMMENRHVANKKADIGAAQFKLEIPISTGFKLPLSITYANGSEEKNKSHFRFNFGFGLDTDKLAALLRAKKQN